jgi:hypothetical protein
MLKKKKKKKNQKKVSKNVQEKPVFHGVNFLAPEFVYYKKSIFWYVILVIIGLALLGVAIWLKYWLFGVVIFLSIIIFIQFSKKRPQSKECHITEKGIKVDDKFFPIESFKSFHIILDEHASHLFLETAKRYRASFWINVKNEDLERVGNALSFILPEKLEPENFMVKINRWMRF